jgi:geranylgeranylglycerol-phosphate geranylgeranyltransferase
MKIEPFKKIWGFIRLLRPEISALGIVCVYIGAISSGLYYFSNELLLGMLTVFFIGAGSMPFNDYFDLKIDKLAHPNRPLSLGIIKPISSLYIGIIFILIGIVLASLINFLCFLISLIGVILILFYELFSKNKGLLGNIVVAFTTSLSFVFGGAIVGNLIKPTFFTLICFFVFLGREILKDVSDFEGDKLHRVTLPMKIGKKPAAYFANIFLIISIVLLFLPVLYGIFNNWYFYLALVVAFVTMYAIILILYNVENAGKSSDILRVSMVLGLILFIIAIIL